MLNTGKITNANYKYFMWVIILCLFYSDEAKALDKSFWVFGWQLSNLLLKPRMLWVMSNNLLDQTEDKTCFSGHSKNALRKIPDNHSCLLLRHSFDFWGHSFCFNCFNHLLTDFLFTLTILGKQEVQQRNIFQQKACKHCKYSQSYL